MFKNDKKNWVKNRAKLLTNMKVNKKSKTILNATRNLQNKIKILSHIKHLSLVF